MFFFLAMMLTLGAATEGATVTSETYQARILDASRERPVVAHFTAIWCGACQHQDRMIRSLPEETQAGFEYHLIDIDLTNLDETLDIRMLPQVVLYVNGEPHRAYRGIVRPEVLAAGVKRAEELLQKPPPTRAEQAP